MKRLTRVTLLFLAALCLALPALAADYVVTYNAGTALNTPASSPAYITIEPGWVGYSIRYAAGVTGTVQIQRKMASDATWDNFGQPFTATSGGSWMNAGGQWQYRFVVTATLTGDVQCVIRQSAEDKSRR